jgi:hypothetical protein
LGREEALSEEKNPGQRAPNLPILMPKRAPTLSPWLGGVEPSDMREAHPRAGEELGSRAKDLLEHDHHDSRKATGHNSRS